MSGGGGSSSPQTTQTTQVSEPWEGQKPYLETGFQRAEQDVLNTPTTYFPESTVIPFSPESEAAIEGMYGRGLYGSGVGNAAQRATMDTLGGRYLGANPYLDQVAADIESQVMPSVQSRFGLSGRSGSPLAAQAASTGMARALAPYAYGSYENERARMGQAAQMAPSLAEMDYRDLAAMAQAGAAREQKSQQQLQDEMNRFYFQQEEPRNRLANYMGLVRGNYGGSTMQQGTSPGTGNPLLQGLGLAATVGSLFV